MPKLLTARWRQARELRDACLMLVARHSLATQQGGVPATEVALDPSGSGWPRRERDARWTSGMRARAAAPRC
jgi:hypothetical protein